MCYTLSQSRRTGILRIGAARGRLYSAFVIWGAQDVSAFVISRKISSIARSLVTNDLNVSWLNSSSPFPSVTVEAYLHDQLAEWVEL
jgi:hypothetical protein